MNASTPTLFRLGSLACALAALAQPAAPIQVEVNRVAQIALASEKGYANPFLDVELDALITQPDGAQLRVPAFWAGGNQWRFRYACGTAGAITWRTECSDPGNARLHGAQGRIDVVPYTGDNPLYRHGPVRVGPDRRHFAHADGTPFFWLGDTWWKGLCGRIPFDGFKQLAADRRAKGFTVVQIVAGPLPDEPPFDPRWGNEGGMPYEPEYARINPAFFDAADRRLAHLIDGGLVPAIVGGWGWHMPSVGVQRMNRHWRYLVARYGAYPVVWVVGGEVGGPEWTAVARALRALDPYHRLTTAHPYNSGRRSLTDDTVLDFDMLQTGHAGAWHGVIGDYANVALNTVAKVTAHYSKRPTMPVLVGEVTYEGHMMSNGADIQRFMFWSSMLNGAAGHTYGAGGIWQMNSDSERGAEYEFTPWHEAMHLPGSAQLGLGRRLLDELPWWRFEPHPEWVDPHSTTLLEPHADWYDDTKEFAARGGAWDLPYAAGVPGEVRVVYIPGHYYQWAAPTLKGLERDLPYHAFLFNPASGKRYALGTLLNAGPPPKPFEELAHPRLFTDDFDAPDSTVWRDHGTPTQRRDGRLRGGKGMVTIQDRFVEADLTVSADARSDAEAGIVLRFHDPDHYLVALYTPSLKAIYLHDRRRGQWGPPLGKVDVPEIGPDIHLAAAAAGAHAAMILTDGQRSYWTPIVEVDNTRPGKTGLWLFQIGDQQAYDNFAIARSALSPARRDLPRLPAEATARRPDELPLVMHENPNIVPAVAVPEITLLDGSDYTLPRLPAPQDWVLVLQRLK